MTERPGWFGPAEQLSLLVASSGSMLLDHTQDILDEVETHSTHASGCRCYQLMDLLHDRLLPATREFQNLSDAIERFRLHRRSQQDADPAQ